MTEKRTEILVGLIVSLGIAIFVTGVIWGRGEEFMTSRYFVQVRFDDVQGLEKGDLVSVRGLTRGKVQSIELKEAYALVRLWLRDDVRLFSDFKAYIGSRELMGGKHVILVPGESGIPADMDRVHQGENGADIWQFLLTAGQTLTRVDTLLNGLQALIDNGRIAETLANLNETSETARTVLFENRRQVRLTVDRLEHLSKRLHDDSTLAHLDRMVVNMDSTAEMIRNLASRLDEGTLGLLINDRWLHDQLMKTCFGLDSLISDIRKNPKKYVKFSIF
ncbi:MAG TPA: MCE family protein [bacterium]|nr:MCE family protein [bacterium]